jgi:hypothetical protein
VPIPYPASLASWRLCGRLPLNTYCFLVILGILGGAINFGQDLLIAHLEKLCLEIDSRISGYGMFAGPALDWRRLDGAGNLASPPDTALQYLFYVGWGLVLTVSVAYIVEKISPQARGSGLPVRYQMIILFSVSCLKGAPRACAGCLSTNGGPWLTRGLGLGCVTDRRR